MQGYLSKISSMGEAAGICVIVPPPGWRPPFCMPPWAKFRTRQQDLSRINGSIREAATFERHLRLYMAFRGSPLLKASPTVGRVGVSLYNLHRAVARRGGFTSVEEKGSWKDVSSECNFPDAAVSMTEIYQIWLLPFLGGSFCSEDPLPNIDFSCTAAKELLQASAPSDAGEGALRIEIEIGSQFWRYFPEEKKCFIGTIKETTTKGRTFVVEYNERTATTRGAIQMPETLDIGRSARTGARKDYKSLAKRGREDDPWEMSGRSSTILSQEVVVRAQLYILLANGQSEATAKRAHKGNLCKRCLRVGSTQSLLACTNCTETYHPRCLGNIYETGLGTKGEVDWFCYSCLLAASNYGAAGPAHKASHNLMSRGSYGFQDGPRHSLGSFRRQANAFRQLYFNSSEAPRSRAFSAAADAAEKVAMRDSSKSSVFDRSSLLALESEYWRLVEGRSERLVSCRSPERETLTRVTYGSDLDSGVIGSGFPTTDRETAQTSFFLVGAHIEARWRGGSVWYPGIIVKSTKFPTNKGWVFDIQYDDGDTETDVAVELVRVVNSKQLHRGVSPAANNFDPDVSTREGPAVPKKRVKTASTVTSISSSESFPAKCGSWTCNACTLINQNTRKQCSACSSSRSQHGIGSQKAGMVISAKGESPQPPSSRGATLSSTTTSVDSLADLMPPSSADSGKYSYATNPWNLNVLPTRQGSLLRLLGAGITGVVVPWVYVGGLFSTFCWHNEDHHLYSVNYHHLGAPKVWYGVPGACAASFESRLRHLFPLLHDAAPDLLLQIVTMASPAALASVSGGTGGVPIVRAIQRPGTFIVTFPAAYHAGFNVSCTTTHEDNRYPPRCALITIIIATLPMYLFVRRLASTWLRLSISPLLHGFPGAAPPSGPMPGNGSTSLLLVVASC